MADKRNKADEANKCEDSIFRIKHPFDPNSANNNNNPTEMDQSGNGDVTLIDHPPESIPKRTKSQEEAIERRKRRRRLRRLLREAGEFPSFVNLISTVEEEQQEEDAQDMMEEEQPDKTPDIVYIDVDEYLGLNSAITKSKTSYADKNGPKSEAVKGSSPQEEGFYTGRVPVAMADSDPLYLSPLQQLIRNNLEFFSATAKDAEKSQAGRRYPIVEGKVGVRCIHCAKVGLDHEASLEALTGDGAVEPDQAESMKSNAEENKKETGDENEDDDQDGSQKHTKHIDPARIWPPGSVSYPLNISNLHSICSQKVQLHFEQCPNLPPTIMAQLYRESTKTGERVRNKEVPVSMYYSVAAKRLGLVNVHSGIRFGRDLNLEPLPLDAVLAQEIQESKEKKGFVGPVQDTILEAPKSAPSPVKVRSGPRPTVKSDASQQVLAEALAEPDNQPNHVGRARDREMVSDYMFLIIRQMSICRATHADFATRGKKTRKMRIGFAGFCCRHCLKVLEAQDGGELARAHGASGFSCRSFSSEPDNLASAISNSFAEHLTKCKNMPKRVRTALSDYKRIHADQMTDLPFGSQGKKFREIWDRLRVADIPEDEMMMRIRNYKPGQPDLPPLISTEVDEKIILSKPKPKPKKSSARMPIKSKSKPDKVAGRDKSFPTSKSPETQKVLAMAEKDWDISTNGGMILLSDRDVISDYIFLTLRQLRPAIPTQADLTKGRRLTNQTVIAGMCCMHCDGKDPSMVATSGRTFPTAPDNYASAFNTQLYSHLQNCSFVRDDVKRALADLRKIHSSQISKLQFGSQRQFFNRLYKRLGQVNVKGKLAPPAKIPTPKPSKRECGNSKPRGRVTRRSDSGDDAIMAQFKFFEAPLSSFFCQRCRMVPLQFRARGSLCFAKPSLDFMKEHHDACKEDGFDLWFCVESLKELLKTEILDVNALSQPLFKDLILECFGGNEELATIFTTEIVKVLQMHRHGGVTQAVENYIKAKSRGLWSRLPITVDMQKVSQAFEKFAAGVEGLSPRLSDHSSLVKYLLLISPSLKLDEEEEEESEDENSDEDEEKHSDVDEEEEKYSDDGRVKDVEDGVAETHRRRGGKELRKKASPGGGQSDEADKGGENKPIPQAVRPRGKELRRKEAADNEEIEDDSNDEHEENSEDEEIVEIERPARRGGKELKKRSSTKPVYEDDDEELSEGANEEPSDEDGNDDDDDGESYREASMAEDEEESTGDIFENDDVMEEEEGYRDNQSEADTTMKEGIMED